MKHSPLNNSHLSTTASLSHNFPKIYCNKLWITALYALTFEQRPLFGGPKGGRCRQVWLYLENCTIPFSKNINFNRPKIVRLLMMNGTWNRQILQRSKLVQLSFRYRNWILNWSESIFLIGKKCQYFLDRFREASFINWRSINIKRHFFRISYST